jgi:hypothetical protein
MNDNHFSHKQKFLKENTEIPWADLATLFQGSKKTSSPFNDILPK